jgi:replicative DNA helicase
VLALSQLSRAVESRSLKDRRPILADLRDSGSIEQDADSVFFLFREAYYLEKEKGADAEEEAERIGRLIDVQNKLEFIIGKQRSGPVGTVDLFIDVACSAVRNAARF